MVNARSARSIASLEKAALFFLNDAYPHNISLDSVSSLAGLSTACIYTHFGSRDEFIAQALTNSLDEFDVETNWYASNNPPNTTLWYLLEALTGEYRHLLRASLCGVMIESMPMHDVLVGCLASYLEYFYDTNQGEPGASLDIIARYHINALAGAVVNGDATSCRFRAFVMGQLLDAIGIEDSLKSLSV